MVDAEPVAGDGSERSIYGVGPALTRNCRTGAVGLAMFDLLWCGGHELVDLPDRHRRRVLEELARPGVGPGTAVRPRRHRRPAGLLRAARG